VQDLDLVVIGAGVIGLCAAEAALRARPGLRLALVDPRPPGHDRGASHGGERIIRATYADPALVADTLRCRAEHWPALEALLGQPLITPGPAVFWGPEDGPLPAYAAAVAAAGAPIEALSAAEARRRCPSMTFAGAERVLWDHAAGVIHADVAVAGLAARVARLGGQRIHAPALGLAPDPVGLRIDTAAGPLRAAAGLLCLGGWLGDLRPASAPVAVPVRQHVGFWSMDVAPGRSPAWVHLGRDALHYGLPARGGGLMKAALHATGAGRPPDAPDAPCAPDPAALAAVEDHLRAWFAPGPGPLRRAEVCLYANAPGDAFFVEPLPELPAALQVAACSGHAFKLAPLVGARAAAWALARV
jgi:sarcosine oxidase